MAARRGRCGGGSAGLPRWCRRGCCWRTPSGSGPRSFEDVLLQIFLTSVEPTLGRERPTFLIDYPASMASLARLNPSDPRGAERVELYSGGVELANGFSELTDESEQRARLLDEQAQRRREGKP